MKCPEAFSLDQAVHFGGIAVEGCELCASFDLSVCLFVFLPLYRLLVITLEKKVVLKCGRMSNILGAL